MSGPELPACLHVLHSPNARVTDLGRNASQFGFSNNGALDEYAARMANALVGNHGHAPLIEVTAGGLALSSDIDTVVAVTGGHARLTFDGNEAPTWAMHFLHAGQRVDITPSGPGLRYYLALAGSFAVPMALESCAGDVVLGIDGRLRSGDRIGLRAVPEVRHGLQWGTPLLQVATDFAPSADLARIPVTPGVDVDRFSDPLEVLTSSEYVMNPRSDLVGIRLDGPAPNLKSHGEIRSAGVPIGAIEVPSGDGVIALHRGRGVTAGYPIPAVLTRAGLDLLAQTRPGQQLQFSLQTTEEARASYRTRREHVEAVGRRARTVLTAQCNFMATFEPFAPRERE